MKYDIEYRIPGTDREELRSLVGQAFSPAVFQRGVNKYSEVIVASMIAVRIAGSEYVQFTTDYWSDTKEFAIDCFRMRIKHKADPVFSIHERTKKPVEVESLKVAEPAAPITRIDVYGFTDTEDEDGYQEVVSYDAALLFHRASARSLLVFVDSSSIAGDVGFLQDEVAVAEKLLEYEFRWNIQET